MPAGDANFRSDYVVDPNLQQKLGNQNYDDPRNEGFFPRYRRWIDEKPGNGDDVLATYFGVRRIRTALELGDRAAGFTEGQVRFDDNNRPDDFDIFNAYIGRAPSSITQAELVNLGLSTNPAGPGITNPTDEQLYEIALRKFLNGEPLTSGYERGLVNGSIIAVARLNTAFEQKGQASTSEASIFAIPGSVVFPWKRSLSDAFWLGVSSKMDEAFATTGVKLINLSGAIQIRTGSPPFPEIKVGSGIVVLGGM